MVNRHDPVEYLAVLNDTVPGDLLQCFEEWEGQLTEALANPAIDNGVRDLLTTKKVLIDACIVNINGSQAHAFIDEQKIKAQTAIDEME